MNVSHILRPKHPSRRCCLSRNNIIERSGHKLIFRYSVTSQKTIKYYVRLVVIKHCSRNILYFSTIKLQVLFYFNTGD